MMLHSVRIQALLIFIGGLFLFSLGLPSQEIIGFESRFYLFALEMWRHGFTWFPTTYQQFYPDYPVTGTGLIYLLAKLTGGLSKWVAVFPTTIASAVTLAVTYLIGILHSRRLGIAAVLFLLLTITFVTQARTISLDQFVTAITTTCFYLACSANELKKRTRLIWIMPLLFFGIAMRGPLGLVIPTGVVCAYFLSERQYKYFFIIGMLAALLLVVCTAILLIIANHIGGRDFVQQVWLMEVMGRIQDVQTPPWYFYFKESIGAYALTYPLALCVLVGMLVKRDRYLIKYVAWAAVIFIGLSIPADKKIRYVLPAVPALALLCGYLFAVGRAHRFFYILRRCVVMLCGVLPLLGIAMVFVIYKRYPTWNAHFGSVLAMLALLQFTWFIMKRQNLIVLAIAALSLVSMIIFVVEPINLRLNKTHDFVTKVEKWRIDHQAKLVFYHENQDGVVIKYLVNMSQDTQPIFVHSPAELAALYMPVLIVMTQENFFQLSGREKFFIVGRGRLGTTVVVVLSKNVSHPEVGF